MTPLEYTLIMDAARERALRLRREAIAQAWDGLGALLLRAWQAVPRPHRPVRSTGVEA